MRVDYILYGLASVFFIMTALSLVVVGEDGKSLWAVSFVVLGLLSASVGYFLKPKIQTTVAVSASALTQEVAPEITSQAPATVETLVVEAPQVKAAVVVETFAGEFPAAVVTPQEEAAPVETLVSSKVELEAPIVAPTSLISEAETSAPNAEVLPSLLVSPVVTLELTQVKGIGEKRAAQLKTNGVNSIEDLAKSDAADLAAKLKISAKMVEKWIAGAKMLIK
jgi:predicted flap endonuclease-1-like 5' DNA nuclease